MRYLKPAAFLLLLVGSSVSVLSRIAIASDDGLIPPQGNELEQRQAPDETIAATRRPSLGTLLDSAQGETNRSLIGRLASTALRHVSTPFPRFSEGMSSQEIASASEAVEAESVTFKLQAPASENKQLETMEDFRRLVQDAQSQPPEPTPEPEDLPTLEEGEDDSMPSPEAVPAVPDLPESDPVDDGLVETEEDTDLETSEDELDLGDIEANPDDASEPTAESADLDAVLDILISDPNPLNVPLVPEEVDIDRNPLVTLEEAIELAYRNNQTLQTSLLQLEQAEAALAEQRAARLPTISTQADIQDSQQGSVDQIQLGGQVILNYDIFTGGGRKASIRAAELQQEVSALAVEAQQEQIRLLTATLYYDLQEAIEQIRINQAFVDEAERNLRDSELRQEVGVGTRFDVLRAEVQLANAQQALVQSQFNEDIARRDIARLLNLPPTTGLQTTPVARAEDWPLDLEESILLAFQNRSELEQQLLQADISEQQRQIALAAIRPQVSITAQYGLESILDSNVPGVDTGNVEDLSVLALNLNWTIFNGGASRAAARQQEIAGQIAEEQFSESLDQIRFDVEQAFFNIQANETNIATSNSAVVQAEAALELANLRLQAGVGTQLDVLTAQSELTQAQVNNVTAILGYNRALVAIQRAISNLSL